ncbi:MAG: two-component system response regulator [Micavibrio aeruginosavorus]|uniref:Two-component system response regulator n=1 Tax=Micavibrio aeruginosavorus TaxID=349221 RepID=A0A2W5A0K4_9BACT|nr:MAG: two-component system response regulator [Micavibrio aeruginosavorus]
MIDRKILIVEDDAELAGTLARSFARRGYQTNIACNTADALRMAPVFNPAYAVVDLKMPGASGLECVRGLHVLNDAMRIVVLTGYASITTAVEAIKLGACYYLAKPSNAEDIIAAYEKSDGNPAVEISESTTSIKNLEWERIHEVLVETGYNISEAARRLGMHRRTLARKLGKRHIS